MGKGISNSLKAIAISAPLILTNPLKGQEPGDTTITHLMNKVTSKTTPFNARRIRKFNYNKAIKEAETTIQKDSLIKDTYTKEEALKLIKKVDSIVVPKLNLHYYQGGKGWLNPPKEESDSCMVITKAHMGIYDALNVPNVKATITNRHHITIRWDANNDGHDASNPSAPENKGDFNWDVLSKKIIPDSTYIKEQNTHPKSIENGCYLSNLDENQLLSLAYWRNGRNLYLIQEEFSGYPHPENPDSLRQVNKKKAIQELNKSLALNKKFPLTHYHRGLTNIVLKNYEEAIEDFSKTLELDSLMINAYVGLTDALAKKGEYKKAIENAKKARKSGTNLSEVYFHEGESYFGLGEYKKAWACYDIYRKKIPPHWLEKYRNPKNARRIKIAEEKTEIINAKLK